MANDPLRVHQVPIEELATSLQPLRCGNLPAPSSPASRLAELPIRAVRDGDRLEVIDGFKRLTRWRLSGATAVPVVIESESGATKAKVALLAANAPPRTVTAMDEVRVYRIRSGTGLLAM